MLDFASLTHFLLLKQKKKLSSKTIVEQFSFMKLTSILLFVFTFLALPETTFTQDQDRRLQEIDIQHYRFQLELNDADNVIKGEATIDISFLKPINEFTLDLVALQEEEGKGMKVQKIKIGEQQLDFQHQGEALRITLGSTTQPGTQKSLTIYYQGIPADGLIIGRNKYGDRTFFGDNWPNRAHHWLPTVDHPADKATVEFIVIAPNHYQVIANGIQIEETDVSPQSKLTHWKTEVRLPTKIMVIGVARFAVQLSGKVGDIPVQTWVYPQNRDEGFYDFHQAIKVLQFFIDNIGPYPYKKLANVQSKTRYGGMENASNIFYTESSVTGQRQHESLIAHEIAHQWFGDSASEANWYHVWLSEGFATYLTDLYFEETAGTSTFRERMQNSRQRVTDYAKRDLSPVINTKVKDYNLLLNANSYQKGSWVLHMLRQEIGEEAFWKTLRQYYQKFHLDNALSEDFQKVAEQISRKKLSSFFNQWLYQAGHPILQIDWEQVSKRKIKINLTQLQEGPAFSFPLEIEIETESGNQIQKSIRIDSKEEKFNIKVKEKAVKIILDPNVKLLFEEG